MRVESDNTPIISNIQIKRLNMLGKSFREVLIRNAVYEELTADKRFIEEAKTEGCSLYKTRSCIKSRSS